MTVDLLKMTYLDPKQRPIEIGGHTWMGGVYGAPREDGSHYAPICEIDDPHLGKMFAASPHMLAALKTILEGCRVSGRWLDASGTECEEGDEGARWEAYSGEEQDQWIATVADLAVAAIAKAEPPEPVATNRPGDQAAIYAEETGVDYATALVRCNMD